MSLCNIDEETVQKSKKLQKKKRPTGGLDGWWSTGKLLSGSDFFAIFFGPSFAPLFTRAPPHCFAEQYPYAPHLQKQVEVTMFPNELLQGFDAFICFSTFTLSIIIHLDSSRLGSPARTQAG